MLNAIDGTRVLSHDTDCPCVIDYRQLPSAVTEILLPHFGLSADSAAAAPAAGDRGGEFGETGARGV